MSETSTLISCTGKISRAELAQVPTPPSTATHVPIPHAAVVEGLVDKSIHCVIARFPFSMRCRSKSTFTRSARLADRVNVDFDLHRIENGNLAMTQCIDLSTRPSTTAA